MPEKTIFKRIIDKEIAAKLNCSLRTVERKAENIRHFWEKELEP